MDHSKDEDCRDEVQEIGQVLSVEGLSRVLVLYQYEWPTGGTEP